jgi:hypothetical protein
MNEERVIKVTRCGDQTGCIVEDRISIEFSPSALSSLEIHFLAQALAADMYETQTEMREMYDAFKKASEIWKEFRKEHK